MAKKWFTLQSFFIFLSVCFVFSMTVGAFSVWSANEFAHRNTEIYAFTGTAVESLTAQALKSLGTPSDISCGQNACVQSIDMTNGKVTCAKPPSDIFGAGECINVPVCIPGMKGCPKSDKWTCYHNTAPKPDCQGLAFAAYNTANPLEKARLSAAATCCPDGTTYEPVSNTLGTYKGYLCRG